VQRKGCLGDAVEAGQTRLGVGPEALDPVDMRPVVGEFVLAVVNPQVLGVAQIAPAANHLLEHGFRAIRDEFGVDFSVSLEDAEHRRLAAGPTVPLVYSNNWSGDTSGDKVTRVDFPLSIWGSATIQQQLAEDLTPDTTYALRVDVLRVFLPQAFSDISLRLYAGGVLIADSIDLLAFSAFSATGGPYVFTKINIHPTCE